MEGETKGMEGMTGKGWSEGPAFAGPGSASLESPKEEWLNQLL